jgi:hypothetical protein
MSHEPFEVWYEERQMLNGEPPFSCSHDAAQAAWNAAQEQHAAPALLTIGRTCVMCGHINVWDVELSAPRAPLSDEQIKDCYDAAKRSYIAERGEVRGQMCFPPDNFNWHFARAIEAAIGKWDA